MATYAARRLAEMVDNTRRRGRHRGHGRRAGHRAQARPADLGLVRSRVRGDPPACRPSSTRDRLSGHRHRDHAAVGRERPLAGTSRCGAAERSLKHSVGPLEQLQGNTHSLGRTPDKPQRIVRSPLRTPRSAGRHGPGDTAARSMPPGPARSCACAAFRAQQRRTAGASQVRGRTDVRVDGLDHLLGRRERCALEEVAGRGVRRQIERQKSGTTAGLTKRSSNWMGTPFS